MEEKKYYITDIESGIDYEVSKEYYDWYMKLWEDFKPKLNSKLHGNVYVFGTGSKNDDYLKNIWSEAKELPYKLKSWFSSKKNP